MLRIGVKEPCPYIGAILDKALEKRKQVWTKTSLDDPDICIQWAEYEDVDWERVLKGKICACSYLHRKGLNRKAQLASYCKRFASKRPNCLLASCIPETVILDADPENMEPTRCKIRRAMHEADQDKDQEAKKQKEAAQGNEDDDEDDGDDNDDVVLSASTLAALNSFLLERQGIAAADGGAEKDEYENNTEYDEEECREWWILKPSLLNKTAGIALACKPKEVMETIAKFDEAREWVLQKYIRDPLLVWGMKFHVRVWVLAVGDLGLYIYENAMALFTGLPYERDNAAKRFSHLTNTGLQEERPDFDNSVCTRLFKDLPLEEYRGLLPAGNHEGTVQSALLKTMGQMVAETFEAASSDMNGFLAAPNCFELYGFDFLIDQQLKIWLLEANVRPDLRTLGKECDFVVEECIEDVLAVTIDRLAATYGGQGTEGKELSLFGKDVDELPQRCGSLVLVSSRPRKNWGAPNMQFRESY